MKQIAPPPEVSKHLDSIMWVNQLIIDLKLQAYGHEPSSPITLERLNEWAEHHKDLARCKQPGILY